MPLSAHPLAAVARLKERLTARTAPEPDDPAPGGVPLPPARLRVLVDGHGSPEGFLADSRDGAEAITGALAAAGTRLEDSGPVLDFGCGCGRIARNWAGLGLELHGCDYNPQLVAWCQENLGFMTATANDLEPPTPYDDGRFGLVYAISILTHLTEPLAERWMAEFARIVRPGGLLLVTTHGDRFRHALGGRALERYDAGEMVVKRGSVPGLNACAAYHPPRYVSERLMRGFEVVAHVDAGRFPQDVYVARRATPPAA